MLDNFITADSILSDEQLFAFGFTHENSEWICQSIRFDENPTYADFLNQIADFSYNDGYQTAKDVFLQIQVDRLKAEFLPFK